MLPCLEDSVHEVLTQHILQGPSPECEIKKRQSTQLIHRTAVKGMPSILLVVFKANVTIKVHRPLESKGLGWTLDVSTTEVDQSRLTTVQLMQNESD